MPFVCSLINLEALLTGPLASACITGHFTRWIDVTKPKPGRTHAVIPFAQGPKATGLQLAEQWKPMQDAVLVIEQIG